MAAPTRPTTHAGGVSETPLTAPTAMAAIADDDSLVTEVGKLSSDTVPGSGGSPVSRPERNRSPVGPELVTWMVTTPGGGAVALGNDSVNAAAAVAVVVAVAGVGLTLANVPPSAGPSPTNPPTSMGARLTV